MAWTMPKEAMVADEPVQAPAQAAPAASAGGWSMPKEAAIIEEAPQLVQTPQISPAQRELQAKQERIAKAPTNLWGALTGPDGSFSAFREKNQFEGEEVERKLKEIQKANPNMSWMDAYEKAGGQVNAGMPPLAAMGGPAATTGIGASTAAGRWILQQLAKTSNATWSTVKKAVGGATWGAAAAGGAAAVNEAAGGSVGSQIWNAITGK